MQKGERSIAYEIPVYFEGEGSVVGKKEGEGPLGSLFDEVVEDPMFGENSWEEAESELQIRAAKTALKKSGLERTQIRYLFAGDLEAQGVASSFGMSVLEIPYFGVFGACSTMGETLILGSSTGGGRSGGICTVCHIESFCQCRERVSVSAGIWKPASPVSWLDSNRRWSLCAGEKKESAGDYLCDTGEDCGLRHEGFL